MIINEKQLFFPTMEKTAELGFTRTSFEIILSKIKKESNEGNAYLNNKSRRYPSELGVYIHDESDNIMYESSYASVGQDIGFFITHEKTLFITEGVEWKDEDSQKDQSLVIFIVPTPNIYNIHGEMTKESVIESMQRLISFFNDFELWKNVESNLTQATNFLKEQDIQPGTLEKYFK